MAAHAEAVGGLFVAVMQMSIALGSNAGGLLFDHSGYRITFFTSAALLTICAVLTGITARQSRGPAWVGESIKPPRRNRMVALINQAPFHEWQGFRGSSTLKFGSGQDTLMIPGKLLPSIDCVAHKYPI